MNGQKKSLMRTLLLIGMGLMIPCYLFTVGNTAFSPWELYDRNRLALVILTPLCLGLLLLLGRASLKSMSGRCLSGLLCFIWSVSWL